MGLLAITALLPGCGAGDGGPGSPDTQNDILEVTPVGAASVAVLANDTDPEGDPMTVSIADAPFVGTATVNSDNTVRLDLPTGFRGVTRFRYRATDSADHSSRSTAAVFVDAPIYRVLFSASTGSRNPELYLSSLVGDPVQLSNAASGALRLESFNSSLKGSVVLYTRSDPANRADTGQKYLVRTSPVGTPSQINTPSGRRFVAGNAGVISPDDKYVALLTEPSSGSGAVSLYLVGTDSNATAARVDNSNSVTPSLVTFGGDTPALYFVAPTSSAGPAFAVFRAETVTPDSASRVSPIYSTGDTIERLSVAPDQTHLLLFGSRNGRTTRSVYLVDPNAQTERDLATDIGASDTVESFIVTPDFSKVVYLARLADGTTGRVSAAATATSTAPVLLRQGAITSLDYLKPDNTAVLITRPSTDPSVVSNVWETLVDGSGDTLVVTAASRGRYDDTGDRVYVQRRDNQPGVLERADFGRSATLLVSSPLQGTIVTLPILTGRSGLLLSDAAADLRLVNFAGPGEEFQVTSMTLDLDPLRLPLDIAGP